MVKSRVWVVGNPETTTGLLVRRVFQFGGALASGLGTAQKQKDPVMTAGANLLAAVKDGFAVRQAPLRQPCFRKGPILEFEQTP